MKPVKMVCHTCGSEDVVRDAWAVWNEAEQRWELGSVFDAAHCNTCDGETRIDEKPIEIAPALELLAEAESFISGFEDDETQEEPVDGLLKKIRAYIAHAEKAGVT